LRRLDIATLASESAGLQAVSALSNCEISGVKRTSKNDHGDELSVFPPKYGKFDAPQLTLD
jgi:hypothetical protein